MGGLTNLKRTGIRKENPPPSWLFYVVQHRRKRRRRNETRQHEGPYNPGQKGTRPFWRPSQGFVRHREAITPERSLIDQGSGLSRICWFRFSYSRCDIIEQLLLTHGQTQKSLNPA